MKKMTKFVTALTLVAMLLTTMCVTAFADGNVTYEGNAKKFVFAPGSDKPLSDLFTEFKGVMPGDSLTQQVVIKNNSAADKVVRIYMRALGAQENTEKFLSQMTLTVTEDNELFNATADQTAQLTDWVLLGEFTSGASMTLNVTLNVPIEMDNDFQNAIGYLDWQFKVEEDDIPPIDDGGGEKPKGDPGDKPGDGEGTNGDNSNHPGTGDTMNMALWGGVASVSVLGVVFLIVARNRRNKEEN